MGGRGVCLSACWDTTPPEQTPPGAEPPGADTPPREQTPPPGPDPPSVSRHPPREADSSIRSTSGRYASYWNAFLFCHLFWITSIRTHRNSVSKLLPFIVTNLLQTDLLCISLLKQINQTIGNHVPLCVCLCVCVCVCVCVRIKAVPEHRLWQKLLKVLHY